MLDAPPLASVVEEIRARCEEAGLAAPSYLTVARRIPALFSPEEIAKKRSANPKHLQRLKPRPGYIHTAHPLDVCQIDHTPTDINFIEVVEGGGMFIGRAATTPSCSNPSKTNLIGRGKSSRHQKNRSRQDWRKPSRWAGRVPVEEPMNLAEFAYQIKRSYMRYSVIQEINPALFLTRNTREDTKPY